MKNKIFLKIQVLLLLSFLQANGQKYLEMMNDPRVNFYDVKKEAEAYFEKNGKDEGSGYEFYKRWEYFNEQRFAPSGNRMITLKKPVSAVQFDFAVENKISDWTCLGPINGNIFWGAGRINYVAIDPTNQNIIWTAAATGGIWKSTDGAANWTPVGDYNQNLGTSAIAINPDSTNVVYIGTGDYDGGSSNSFGLIKTVDGGATWQLTGLQFDYVTDNWPKISDVNINPDSTAQILVSTTRGLFLSKNAGQIFSKVLSIEAREIRRHPANSEIIYIATANHKIYRSVDGGDTWTISMTGIGSGGSLFLLAVTKAAPNNLYVANLNSGSAEGFYLSTDSGESFTKKASKIGVADLVQLGYNDCMAVSSIDPNIVMIGAVHLGKSIDGGATWKQISQWDDPHCDHHFLIFDSTGTFYTANDGGLWKSPDNGSSWARCNGTFTAEQYYKMAQNRYSPDVVLAGSQDNGFHYMNSNNWGQGNGGDAMDCTLDPNNPAVMVGLGYMGGSVLRSTNGGKSWLVNSTDNFGLPTDNGNWVSPLAIDPIVPNTYYLGLANLWKTNDFCKKWRNITNNVTNNTKLTAIEIYPKNSNIIYIAAGNKIFRTLNGGISWSVNIASNMGSTETITSIAISQNNPDEIWITKSGFNSGNKVFVTYNGGESWSNVTLNLPNLPFNTIVLQNDTANSVYAGCDESVYYKNQNMSQWADFNNRLPRTIIEELNIYAPKGKLRACTYGRGIWETGMVKSQPVNVIDNPSFHVYYADKYIDDTTVGTNLFDNDPQTVWTSAADTIHELRIDLLNTYWIDGLIYIPDTNQSKLISEYSVYISKDSSTWKRLVSSGNWADDTATQNLDIYPTEGRYLKIVTRPVSANDIISVSDLRVCGVPCDHPIADFELPDSVFTTNGEVSLSDKSTNGPTEWLWEFGDGTFSTDQNPIHTYSRKGKYQVNLTASNSTGMDTKILQTYVSIKPVSSSLQEITETTGPKIYPNPARESFTVECSELNIGLISSIEIYDIKGSLIYKQTQIAEKSTTIVTDNFRKNGHLFIVKTQIGDQKYTQKLELLDYKKNPEHEKENNKNN